MIGSIRLWKPACGARCALSGQGGVWGEMRWEMRGELEAAHLEPFFDRLLPHPPPLAEGPRLGVALAVDLVHRRGERVGQLAHL